MPSRTRKNISYDRTEDALPDLNPGALQSLAQKIQDSFQQPSKGSIQTSIPKGRKDASPKNPKNHGEAADSKSRPRLIATEGHGTEAQRPKWKASKGHEPTKSKKRLRNGQVKGSKASGKYETINSNNTELGSRHGQQSLSRDKELEGEVLALGGTHDDLELLRDEASESEIYSHSNPGRQSVEKGLTRELHHMVEGLGIQRAGKDVRKNANSSNGEMKNRNSERRERMQNQGGGNGREKDIAKPSSQAHIRFDGGASQSSEPMTKPKIGGKNTLSIQPQSEWHSTQIPPLPEPKREPKAIPLDLSDRLHQHAQNLLEKENASYAAHYGSASTERKFYSTLMSAGTLSDKISALTLSVQESPLHNMKALEGLLILARKRSRDQAVNVLGALKDLFGPGNLLPSDRRLRNFANQPGLVAAFDNGADRSWTSSSSLPETLREAHLITFAYEDWLKSIFFQMLQILETWCNDEVIYARGKAVEYIASLLRDKPEQEANLLRLIVNKLGDSDRKVASKASFNILQLETCHPLMKPTIVAAIESDTLFRPNQSLHAQYYAIITLNQTVLSTKEEALARKLLSIYFDLFAKLLRPPEQAQQEAGVRITSTQKVVINKKGEIQGGGSLAGKKALKKQEAATKSANVEDDLREKLLSAILTGINRAVPYSTTNDDFFEKHMDTLYRITHSANFNTSVQALMLIQQINSVNQGSQDRFYRVLYESLLDSRLLTSSKQALYLNLLFRALRSDLNQNRVKAFVKRLLQATAMHQPPFMCGVLYLVRELEKTFPALTVLVDNPEEDASGDEETFHDVDDNDEVISPAPNRVVGSTPRTSEYDPRKRDPIHAKASSAALWELPVFITHYHPSVSLFARCLLGHDEMPQKPDLQQNTLISFLDRFVYKNPKISSNAKVKGPSIMQPFSSTDDGNVLLPAGSRLVNAAQPVNSDAFWRQEDKDVGVHEVFFHKYFRTVKSKEEKKREKKAKKNRGDGDDADSGSDEEEEAAIWKALVDSRPEIEGDESDVDMDFSDDEELAAALDGEDSDPDLPDLDEDSLSNDETTGVALGSDNGLSDIESTDDDEISGKFPKSVELENASKTRSAGAGKERDKNFKKRKATRLPTFASADDYAKMIAEGSDKDEA